MLFTKIVDSGADKVNRIVVDIEIPVLTICDNLDEQSSFGQCKIWFDSVLVGKKYFSKTTTVISNLANVLGTSSSGKTYEQK